ncbi:hypothetical protein [Protaetiibacter larvae]|uniref:hypothetical protein n=1 Tax=Protaetiibacter larvae TaxID=2592654 RepID=UPI001AEF4DF1|nr:hypothetical protein [Protaetiibacter larvae]
MPTLARLGALALAAALALSACAPTPAPAPSAAPSGTPSASPEETPTPTPTRPPLAELVLTPQGIGEVRIGEPVPGTDPALAIVTWNATGCADSGIAEGEPWAGYWQSTEAGSPHEYGPPFAFFLTTEGGVEHAPVAAVRVLSDVRTAAGIGIGSTRAEVEAAYPTPTATINHFDISTVYVLEEGDRRISIEVAEEDTGGYWPPEQAGRVLFMWAGSTEHEAGGIAGGDGGGPCPV